jgi:hypothetical protein
MSSARIARRRQNRLAAKGAAFGAVIEIAYVVGLCCACCLVCTIAWFALR